MNLRYVALAEVDHSVDVALDVAEEFFEPGLALSVCSTGSDGGKHRGFAELAGSHPGIESVAHGGIFDDAPTADHSGNVERLRWRAERDAALGSVVAGVEKRGVTVPEKLEVAVNFVAHHYNAGLTAYRGELGKGVAAPLNADWVVRVAE